MKRFLIAPILTLTLCACLHGNASSSNVILDCAGGSKPGSIKSAQLRFVEHTSQDIEFVYNSQLFQSDGSMVEKTQKIWPMTAVGRQQWLRDPSQPEYPLLLVSQPAPEAALQIFFGATDQTTPMVHLTVNFGSSRFGCTTGPAYAAFFQRSSAAPIVDARVVGEALDSILALSCRTPGATRSTHHIRASHESYASLSVMIGNPDPDVGGMIGTDFSAVFEMNGTLIYVESRKHLPPATVSTKRFELQQREMTKDAEKIHLASLFDEQGVETKLECSERQNYSALMNPIAEFKDLPKDLPGTPGTLAELNSAFCTSREQSIREALRVSGRYSELLVDKDIGVNGTGIRLMEASLHPSGKECAIFQVSVDKDNSSIAAVKKIIGESLEGVLVDYQLRGRAIAHE